MQISCVIIMFLNPPGRKPPPPSAVAPPSDGGAVSDPSESDLADAPTNASSRRGRKANPIGRSARDASERAAPPHSRKRQRGAADTVGDAAEASLLSPDKMQKVQGRVNASGIMVSVKDGRVLGKHLELKQLGFTVGYRNPKNTNT